MILLPHIITGAAIGAKTQNLGLIIILGILIHFILDRIPHWDYSIKGIEGFRVTKNFRKLIANMIKIGIDGLIGLLVVFLVLWQKDLLNPDYLLFTVISILLSTLPDILTFLSLITSNKFLDKIAEFHESVHFKTEKEGVITFLGISTQVAVIIFALAVFFI